MLLVVVVHVSSSSIIGVLVAVTVAVNVHEQRLELSLVEGVVVQFRRGQATEHGLFVQPLAHVTGLSKQA